MVPAGMGGDGGGSIRIPSACCGLFGLKPQRGRVSTAPQPAPVVGARHRRTAHPQRARQRDRLRRRSAATSTATCYRAGESGSFVEAAGREPGPAPDRLVDEAGDARRPAGPDPRPGRRRTPRGCWPTSATTSSRSTRTTPTRRSRSCRSSSPASAPSPTRSSTTTGWSGGPARPTGWAPGSRRGSSTGRCAQTEKVSVKANRVFDSCDVLLTPTIAHRPPPVGILGGKGTVGSALRVHAGHRVRRALERRRQPGRLGAVRDRRPTACPPRSSWSAAPTTRPRCSASPRRSSAPVPGRLVAGRLGSDHRECYRGRTTSRWPTGSSGRSTG